MIADRYLAQNKVNVHDLQAAPAGLRRLGLGEPYWANVIWRGTSDFCSPGATCTEPAGRHPPNQNCRNDGRSP
jgi:hypothetical protein